MDSLDRSEIAASIESYIRDRFAVAENDDRFGRSVKLFEAGYVDSVGVAEVLAFLEDRFDVRIPDRHLTSDRFQTIDGMADVIADLRSGSEEGSTS